jgi:homoserine O-acetyltransferase
VRAALRRVTARTIVAGVDTDRLFPLVQQRELAAGITTADDLRVITSEHGHDAFLIESDQVGALVGELLPTPVHSRGLSTVVRR